MQDSHRPTALHSALRFVITSHIPLEHKSTLIEVLTQALRDNEAAELRREEAARARGEWQEHEIEQLKTFLRDRIARSWQHADEGVMHLAGQLRRDPQSVRDKAIDLSLGASVDYRFARALRQGRE